MCGIAGVIGADARSHVERVGAMLEVMHQRGPDEKGIATFDGAVLGTARLSVIDPADGHQPLIGNGGRLAVACNGEIYGHAEHRRSFADYPFTTGSDCELVLPLYNRFGPSFVDHLPGTFALAVWDDGAGQLVLARDRFGERPLYYVVGQGVLAFASDSRALRVAGYSKGSPDPDVVAEMLRQGYIPPDRSIWSDVAQLPPATRLVAEPGEPPRIDRWWRPGAVDGSVRDSDAVEWFRTELDRAVRDQLVADVPVGTFLSGGVDSGTITAIAARHHSDLQAFSFDMPGDSEVEFARQIAAQHGVTLHTFTPDQDSIANEILALPEAYTEPLGDSSTVPTRMLCEFARQHVTVVLTGDGADELLGGYAVWNRDLLGTPAAAPSQAPRSGFLERARRWGSGRPPSLGPAPATVAGRYAAFRQYFSAGDLVQLGLPPRSAADVDVSSYDEQTVNDLCRFDIDHYLPGDILVKTDRASMACGLEVRAPFLDARVAERCLSLPARLKVDDHHEKILLRKAFAELIPPAVLNRRKQGFGSPMARWLTLPAVDGLVHTYLRDPNAAIFDLLDHRSTQRYTAEADQRMWSLLVLSIWWSRYA